MPRFYTNLEEQETGLFQKVLEWDAPERQWSPKSRSWYVIYSLFFVSIIFIAALLQEYIFIVAVIAFSFLWFIQGSIPPQMTKHTITSIGVRAFNKLYTWDKIKHFWISQKSDTIFLNLEIEENDNKGFVKRIPLIISSVDNQKIFDLLINNIDYGDKDEISFNFLTPILTGKYFDISHFMVENEEDYSK